MKEPSLIWSHIGYSGSLLKKLSKQDLLDAQTRDVLQMLLRIMRRTQMVVLTHFAVTMIFTFGFMALLFGGMADQISVSAETLGVIMPLVLAVWVSLGVNLYGSMWHLKRRAAGFLA